MPDEHYDFCLCYDVIHDCSDPSSVMAQVRTWLHIKCTATLKVVTVIKVKKALKPNAPWLVVDIKSFQKPEGNDSYS